jgi:hypothetical protein
VPWTKNIPTQRTTSDTITTGSERTRLKIAAAAAMRNPTAMRALRPKRPDILPTTTDVRTPAPYTR